VKKICLYSFIFLIALVSTCLLSGGPAHAIETLVFDFEPDKSFKEKWEGAALTDFTIRALNKARPGAAMPRERLQRLVARWSRTIKQTSSFETRDAIRQHAGARFIIEGSLSQSRNGTTFTGTIIDPDKGPVNDISFTLKNFDLAVARQRIIRGLRKSFGLKYDFNPSGVMGTDDNVAYKLYWKGVAAYEQGYPDTALKLLEESAGRDAKYIEPQLLTGRIMLEKTLFSQAADLFRRIAKLAPSDPRVYFLLGLTYSFQRQNSLALDSFKRAAELDPANPEYISQLGRFRKDTFRFSDAIVELQKATDLDQSLYDAWYDMAVIYASIKQETKALDSLEKAVQWGGPEIMARMENDADLAWLHDNVRFQTLLLKSVRP
jgi:hypothetical protein